jgi:transposase
MHRHALSDTQWCRVQRVLPPRKAGPESTRGDRLFVEAVLYRARTGLPWRDLPERFGPWKTVYNRFSNWSGRGHWARIFQELQIGVDKVGAIMDGSVVRAHQDSSGGKGGSSVTLSVALVGANTPRCMLSSTPWDVRSTSRSRKGNSEAAAARPGEFLTGV